MKTILVILFIDFALSVSAQTNLVSTNHPATNSPPSKQVVTKEMVMQGIDTLSKQINELETMRVARKKQYDTALSNLDLAFASGKIPSDPNVFGGGKQRYEESIRQKYKPELDQIDKQIATVKLQRIQLCQRYGISEPKDQPHRQSVQIDH